MTSFGPNDAVYGRWATGLPEPFTLTTTTADEQVLASFAMPTNSCLSVHVVGGLAYQANFAKCLALQGMTAFWRTSGNVIRATTPANTKGFLAVASDFSNPQPNFDIRANTGTQSADVVVIPAQAITIHWRVYVLPIWSV